MLKFLRTFIEFRNPKNDYLKTCIRFTILSDFILVSFTFLLSTIFYINFLYNRNVSFKSLKITYLPQTVFPFLQSPINSDFHFQQWLVNLSFERMNPPQMLIIIKLNLCSEHLLFDLAKTIFFSDFHLWLARLSFCLLFALHFSPFPLLRLTL